MSSSSPKSAKDYVEHALCLMKQSNFFDSSCVLRVVYTLVPISDRSKLAHLLVQCGVALHDPLLMSYVADIPSTEWDTQHLRLARLMLNTTIHENMKRDCLAEVANRPAFTLNDHGWDQCIMVCAGGDALLTQLFCNLKSLEVFWTSPDSSAEQPAVVVVHAAEVSLEEQAYFRKQFAFITNLSFFDLEHSLLVVESELTAQSLRGYQIKLAAMVAIPARHVLMIDADLLWLRDPRDILNECRRDGRAAYLFSDFWHFVTKRHERTSSTSFLYALHGIDYNRREFESGVVYMNRELAYNSIAMLRHMAINHKYYFNLTFGDKDLYYLALRVQGHEVPSSPQPKMLGTLDDRGLFHSQSMIQMFGDQSTPSHIHTTLHPINDDDVRVPTHICNDGDKIHFVQRTLNSGKVVGTVACETADAEKLETPNVYQYVYLLALHSRCEFQANQAGAGRPPLQADQGHGHV